MYTNKSLNQINYLFKMKFIIRESQYNSCLIELKEATKLYEEGKICKAGREWADKKFKKHSAYKMLAASKYCKDPNYGKGRGKD